MRAHVARLSIHSCRCTHTPLRAHMLRVHMLRMHTYVRARVGVRSRIAVCMYSLHISHRPVRQHMPILLKSECKKRNGFDDLPLYPSTRRRAQARECLHGARAHTHSTGAPCTRRRPVGVCTHARTCSSDHVRVQRMLKRMHRHTLIALITLITSPNRALRTMHYAVCTCTMRHA